MRILWQLEKAFVKEILPHIQDKKLHYNTVSTIVRHLEDKGFVAHEKKGKGYWYFPLLARETYSNQSINKLMNNYFDGSFKSMVSFFMKKNELDTRDLEAILTEINKKEE
jgi:predicted transcriptional regulator